MIALAALLAASLTLSGSARANNMAASLVAEGPAAPGDTVLLALDMRPAKGWHGYWSNPGDAGFGMTLDWTLPRGASVAPPRYPVPRTLLVAGLMNHVYDSEFAVLVPLTLPADAKPGTALPVRVTAKWLVCTDQVCVPEQADFATTVAITAAGTAVARDPRFAGWQQRLPAPLGAPAHFAIDGARLRIAVPLPASVALDRPHFFAGEERVVAYGADQRFGRSGDTLVIDLQRADGAIAPSRLAGVLRLNAAGDGLMIGATPGALPVAGDAVAGTGDGAAAPTLGSLPLLLLAALAGGLLLNIMPCVFPILSLKALSLARAGESAGHARAEGLAYTGGVVLACLGLGGLLLALRAGGSQVGWAFQLQEPGVVAALLLLAVAITANFAGLFELAIPGFATNGGGSSRGTITGAFATGLLAAFVATPCTGPFMAAATGAALLLPTIPALALFATLGLGIALPFLAIAFVPALRRALPRPGRWMVWFRHAMAVPMALTALALLWLASRLGGTGFAIGCTAFAALLVVGLALAGRRQRRGLAIGAAALSGLLAFGIAAVAVLPRLESAPTAEAPDLLAAQPFSETALAQARASGKPVFAWFTADWCLTCKVNENVAIERADVRDAFSRAGVVTLRGDWTRRDPAITRYLTAQGAAGVPLYIWYPAGGGAPRQLPQVLTPGSLTGLVGR